MVQNAVLAADERILPRGTAYLTDLGMVGPMNSILGVKSDIIIRRFMTALPSRFELADGPNVYSALVVEIDDKTNRTVGLERILFYENSSI